MPILAWSYTTLIAALQAWPVHASPGYIANLPNLVGLGERRLWGDLNIEEYDVDDETTVQAAIGNTTVGKPADCIQIRSAGLLVSGEFSGLELRSRDYCKNINAGAANSVPQFYAELTQSTLLLAPPPDVAYQMSYRYLGNPAETLSSSTPNTTTWLSRAAPDALLAACLAEAEQYIKADDRYQDYIAKYNNELLPRIRAELRQSIRAGDYGPMKAASAAAG
jgi:hypothetical protein